MSNVNTLMRSNKTVGFLALLITLAFGITIGTIVSDGVFSAEEQAEISQLKVSGEGNPLVLNQEATLSEGFAQVAKKIEPAVVNINTTRVISSRSRSSKGPQEDTFREFFGDDFFERYFGKLPKTQKLTNLGSGFIVDSKGYILTNYHIIARAEKINIRLSNGRIYEARVKGADPDSDVAVLTIDSDQPLPFARVGETSKMQVGDWVLAVGSPFGLEQTVTAGIVSFTGRLGEMFGGVGNIFGDYIQTDASINPGNSGGPLVNLRGEVIGINSFISTRSGGSVGVGFAIPSHIFINAYNQLITKGKIERGWLGVEMNALPMTPEMAEFFKIAGTDPEGIRDGDGVLITQLIDEFGNPAETGPAYEAGIRSEDVIVRFGGLEIETNFDLRSTVANTAPGKNVELVALREGKRLDLQVQLAERTLGHQPHDPESLSFEEREERERTKEIGLEFETLTTQEAERMGLQNEQGVRILKVSPASLADAAGLLSNMIITQVNGSQVQTAQKLKERVTAIRSGSGVILRVVFFNQPSKKQGVSYHSFVKP